MSSVPPCSRSCWGPIHIHLQSKSFANDLWHIAQATLGIPGLIGETISCQDTQAQPLSERIVDSLVLGFIGLMALGAAPFFILVAAIVKVVEIFFYKPDVLEEMKSHTEQFGSDLEKQKVLIEKFGPLLELRHKIPGLTTKMDQKTQELKESTQALTELEKNYPPNAELLKDLSDMLKQIEKQVPGLISNPTGIEMSSFEAGILILKQIVEEKRKQKKLVLSIEEEMRKAEEKIEKLKPRIAEATIRGQIKEEQIEGLRTILIDTKTPKNKTTELPHGTDQLVMA